MPGIGGATAPWIERIRGTQRPLLFSLRNAFRRSWRTALTLVTLAFGGAAFLGRSICAPRSATLSHALRRHAPLRPCRAPRRRRTRRTASPPLLSHDPGSGARRGVERRRARRWWMRATSPAVPAHRDSREHAPDRIATPCADAWLRDSDARSRDRGEHADARGAAAARGGRAGRPCDRRPHLAMDGGGMVASAGPQPEAFVTRAALARITGDARVTTLLIRAHEPRCRGAFQLVAQRARRPRGRRLRGGLESAVAGQSPRDRGSSPHGRRLPARDGAAHGHCRRARARLPR